MNDLPKLDPESDGETVEPRLSRDHGQRSASASGRASR